MATFTRHKSKKGKTTYRAIIRLTGAPTQSRSFPTREQAKTWAAERERMIRLGDCPSVKARVTIAELLDEYVARKLDRMKTSTEREAQMRKWARMFRGLTLDRVTPERITRERDKLAENMQGVSVNRWLSTLSSFFSWTIKEKHLLKVNPLSQVRFFKGNPHRVRYLSDEERKRLFDAAKRQGPRMYTLVVAACYTGMRRGELLALRWSDVDLVDGWAMVRTSKNGKPRKVPVRGPALNALLEYKAGIDEERGNVVDIHASKRRVFGVAYFPGPQWRKILAESRVKDFRFHDLRHCAASYLAMTGCELLVIATFLGHSQLSMVKRYAHLAPKHVGEAVDRMVERFG